jgi:hypothetical protein
MLHEATTHFPKSIWMRTHPFPSNTLSHWQNYSHCIWQSHLAHIEERDTFWQWTIRRNSQLWSIYPPWAGRGQGQVKHCPSIIGSFLKSQPLQNLPPPLQQLPQQNHFCFQKLIPCWHLSKQSHWWCPCRHSSLHTKPLSLSKYTCMTPTSLVKSMNICFHNLSLLWQPSLRKKPVVTMMMTMMVGQGQVHLRLLHNDDGMVL